ncbi:MAG: orotate phosphoribosyltransferase [Rickettsiella sp.]|nr:orotate phosphoribosyltransferase [Rickettsiella sp.]
MIEKQALIKSLTEINVIKFGEFTLRSGVLSPIYIDLRSIIAYPKILRTVATVLWEYIKDLKPTLLCGVPYTALPIASCISLDQNIPMVICRKEVKDYGTKKQLEGVFEKGQNCLIIEDVVTTGGSILKTIDILKENGLQVTDVVVLVDREQGGREILEEHGYRLHAVFTLNELCQKSFSI